MVFSELFDIHRNRLREDQLLIVEARISNRGYNGEEDSELRITAEQLYDLAGIRTRFAKQLRIHCGAATSDLTASLKTLLTPFSPQAQKPYTHYCPVTLIYRNESASSELELGNDWRVYLHDDLLESLNGHFKYEKVEIV